MDSVARQFQHPVTIFSQFVLQIYEQIKTLFTGPDTKHFTATLKAYYSTTFHEATGESKL